MVQHKLHSRQRPHQFKRLIQLIVVNLPNKQQQQCSNRIYERGSELVERSLHKTNSSNKQTTAGRNETREQGTTAL